MMKKHFAVIALPFHVKSAVLALGSQSKNTVCFAKGRHAYVSAPRADLEDPRDFLGFEKDVQYFLKQKPQVIAYDLHPEYQSTKYAQYSIRNIQYSMQPVQHHHAHIASCMVDNGLANQKVIGVAFDGTGMGSDGTLWGAEFLAADYHSFERVAHLKEVPLLGGQRAIKEPWRLSAWWLSCLCKDKFAELDIDWAKRIDGKKWQVLNKLYAQEVNSPLSGSMGRLFDAVGSLILGKHSVEYEAALAIELEKMAASCKPEGSGLASDSQSCKPEGSGLASDRQSHKLQATSYPFHILKIKGMQMIDPIPLFKELVRDLKAHKPKEEMAFRFHLTVARMIETICIRIRRQRGIKTVVLSGGVFQNTLLLKMGLALLYEQGFIVLTHRTASCSDAGIALGQAAIGAHLR